jgi:hypothetical protein
MIPTKGLGLNFSASHILLIVNIYVPLSMHVRALAADVLYGILFSMFRKKREKTTKTPPQQKPYI